MMRVAIVRLRQAEPTYRMTLKDQLVSAVGCLVHMAAILVGSALVWALFVALLIGGAK